MVLVRLSVTVSVGTPLCPYGIAYRRTLLIGLGERQWLAPSGGASSMGWLVGSGEVPRGEKMLYSGTDPESYITEYSLVYEDYSLDLRGGGIRVLHQSMTRMAKPACSTNLKYIQDVPGTNCWARQCFTIPSMIIRCSGP